MKNTIDIEKGRYWDDGPMVVRGCTKISPGCEHCWSLTMTRIYQKGAGFVDRNNWTGKTETSIERLIKVCKPKKQRVISLWNDLFNGNVPSRFQDSVYAVSMLNKQHTFLILTKRVHNMAHYWETPWVLLGNRWYSQGRKYSTWKDRLGEKECGTYPTTGIPNVWHGLTVCNQQEWKDKGELFLQIPGKKFISHEPALEGIDYGEGLKQIDCLIAGGETGSKARPSHPDIFRADRDQCQAAGVSFFFKGWGKWGLNWLNDNNDNLIPGSEWMDKGIPKTGRMLDGRTHDDLPWYNITKEA